MKKRLKDLAFSLNIPLVDLVTLTEELDNDSKKFYSQWDEPKTDEFGQPKLIDGILQTRPINAPSYKLKKTQSKILTHCFYKMGLPPYFFAGAKGKDAVKNARYHQGNKYFFLTDLKDFYPSISSTVVEKALRNKGFYPDVARLITRICTKDGAVPQGCPTSSFISALVVDFLLGDMIRSYQEAGFKVSFYVDDLTVSSVIDFKHETLNIIDEIRKSGLNVNFKKTRYCSKNPVVTGVVVKNNGIAPLPHTFERAKDINRSEESRKGHQHRINYIKKSAKEKFI
jgi:RNA-directed DNA polymerase